MSLKIPFSLPPALFQSLSKSLEQNDLTILAETQREEPLKQICNKIVEIFSKKVPDNWAKLDSKQRNIFLQKMKKDIFLSTETELTSLMEAVFENFQDPQHEKVFNKIGAHLEYEYIAYLENYSPTIPYSG